MNIEIRSEGQTTVVDLVGKLDGSPAPDVFGRILTLIQPGRQLKLDLSGIEGFSNRGLRQLLLFFRHVHMMGAALTAREVPQELTDTAEAAGFLDLFLQPPEGRGAPIPAEPIPRIDVYPTHHYFGHALRIGVPLPFGATQFARGVNFAVFSHYGSSCTLVLFRTGAPEPFSEIPFPAEFRIGDVFSMIVFDLDSEDLEYGIRVDGPFAPEQGHRFDPSKILLDPMASSIVGRETWGMEKPGVPQVPPFRGRIVPEDFDWEGDRPLELRIEDLVIYEMHVRGFTRSPSAGVKFPGTFAGLREKIGYLKKLGVNCVELMPVFEYDELENERVNPATGERLYNYWGYSTIGFCAPKAGYASTGPVGMQADEFKALIKELHRDGIEVILDVVFNHTAEGNDRGPTVSFRGLDNKIYYLLTPDGDYYNFSGCGNTLNCNHPVVRDFVLNCLRYWVAEYHIDGFRFDLASILGRDVDGAPLPNPPLLEALAMDPVLSKTKLIAEAWDAGGLYQVGTFPAYGRWAEWNGKFRDCVRKFLKGDIGQVVEMAQRVLGSPDLYPTRGPAASVNFITCHDGFTLADLVSYNDKHNEANGEDNRDGCNDNYSWNCGIEGPTEDPEVNALRERQIKNALSMLFLSQGVPMLLMGDECGRTQQGNNNTYCHDSPLNWFDWSLEETNAELFRFCQQLIRFRRLHPVFRGRSHGTGREDRNDRKVIWHGTRPFSPDWSPGSRVLAFLLRGGERDQPDAIYVAMNMYWKPLVFELPSAPDGRSWRVFSNTAGTPPGDICDPGQESLREVSTELHVEGRSIMVLVAR